MLTLTEIIERTGGEHDRIGAAIIDQFGASEEIQGTTYGTLRDYVVNAGLEALNAAEDRYIEDYFTRDDLLDRGAISKSGKIFRTKILPPTYINARNTLANAINLGIDIDGKAKTALEKECSTKRKEGKPLETREQKIEKHAKALLKLTGAAYIAWYTSEANVIGSYYAD